MENNKSYFELFSLPVSFDINLSELNSRFRELQKAAHPDKYANAIEQERLKSVQSASLINSAYNTLKDPIKRAEYMLEATGFDLKNEKRNSQAPAFLMQQIELHEQIEEAQSNANIELLDKTGSHILDMLRKITDSISDLFAQDPSNFDEIGKKVQEAQFFVRLKENVDSIILDLESND